MSYENYISEKNIRKCQFYVRYMEKEISPRISTRDEFDLISKSENTDKICQWVNTALDDYFHENEINIDRFVTRMKSACKDELLPEEDFEWMANPRICLWAWYHEVGYRHWRNETFPNHRGRFKALTEYFDEMDRSGRRKKEILDELKRDWQRKGDIPDPFAKDDDNEIIHRWDYAAKEPHNITRYFSPMDTEDKKICLTGFYDVILDTPEKQELFKIKINSALSSQKTRDKKGRENINKKFYISHENNKKLGAMLKQSTFNQDALINRLIAEEFDRWCNVSLQS